MKTIEPTHTITIENDVYVVSQLDKQVQDLVALLDDWRQRENALTSELLMVSAALRDIKNNIYVIVRRAKQDEHNADTVNATDDSQGT